LPNQILAIRAGTPALALTLMGLFNRKSSETRPSSTEARPELLPPDIVAQMEKMGRLRSIGHSTEETLAMEEQFLGSMEEHFLGLSQEEKQTYVDALADTLLPPGGWAAYGAASLLVKTMFEPDDYPAYVKLLLTSLEFKRTARVSEQALSLYELEFWRKHNPSTEWLESKDPPARVAAPISPLDIGDEREVGRHESAPDSNRVFVAREAEDRYLAVVDQPIHREKDPRRVRSTIFEADNVYDVYVFLGQTPFPNFWNESELEPFCIYGRPRFDTAS
jgi:hypothetical protein